MKIVAGLLCIVFFYTGAKGMAQGIDLSVKDMPLRDVFSEISKQTGFSIICSKQLFDGSTPVSIHVKNASLRQVLDECLKNQELTYDIEEKMIMIRRKEKAGNTLPGKDRADTAIVVTGVVKGENNIALPGVSVKVKGGSGGMVTDADGRFRLTLPPQGVLVFSFIGYKTTEVPLSGRQSLNLHLEPANSGLDEVVVIGYGAVKRGDLTGAVGKVNMDDFSKAPVPTLEGALAGRVAGVTVSTTDGQPGSLSNIVIRGAGSVTQDNSPLFVVDGFPIENPDNNTINPSDIESIDVLKDASATAIYGARGANGVVIITTKSGKKGQPVISYNPSLGIMKNIQYTKMMNAADFVEYQLQIDPARKEIYFDSTRAADYYQHVQSDDLQRQLYRTGVMQNHEVSVRGGSDKSTYAISANALNQDGIVINSGFQRYQGRVNINQQVRDNLKVGINVNYSTTKATGSVFAENPAGHTYSYIYNVLGYRPTSGVRKRDVLDELFDVVDEDQAANQILINPIISMRNEHRLSQNNNLVANGFIKYDIIPHLSLNISGGIQRSNSVGENFYNSNTSQGNKYRSIGVNGRASEGSYNDWVNSNTLTYDRTFNKKHKFNVMGGFTMQGRSTQSMGISAQQVPNESLGIDGLDEAPVVTISKSSSRWGLISYLGRMNYEFDSRYLFTANFRVDGSSKFAPGSKWGYFPSGAFAWRMSREKFMKNMAFISDAKLRVTIGQSGNNRVGDFSYLSTLSMPVVSGYSFNNATPSLGTALGALGSSALQWETSVQTNIGYDLSLFKDRISLTADVYRKITDNLLLRAEVPYVTGYMNAFKNVGKTENKGLELTLNTINIQGKAFTWSSNFNIAFNQNKILALAHDQTELQSRVSFAGSYSNVALYVARVGQPLAQFYGLVWDGVYQYEDFNKNSSGKYVLKDEVTTNGVARNSIQPGDIKYKDLNGDLVVNSDDFTTIGRAIPKHVGGFSNNFTYRNFDLNLFFQWSYGNKLFNANRLIFEGNGTSTKQLNQYDHYKDRWTPENPSNTLFRAGGQGPMYYSTRVLEDGSYLRLKTVYLGYSFSNALLRQIKMKGLKVYAAAQNLLTWTNYSGPDPEVSTRNSNLTPGFDYSAYPRALTVTVGINASF
ncbi:TonB-dependent receptor [Chitinophaga cymbidii]|uniref:SusC/RagA family TonB-linked outer membrane protein n=1 Tax=Chitinophaga cymbidii TaxID=1096750 RepID=A0A512RG74_9BACT|nr:TonB-dependent receptor [Chitinophaga cymbidii]GEP94709.1 SusC/RagA family TonB-linked outer membrane protein [Chitinophaga cymbidii]